VKIQTQWVVTPGKQRNNSMVSVEKFILLLKISEGSGSRGLLITIYIDRDVKYRNQVEDLDFYEMMTLKYLLKKLDRKAPIGVN
jgi:hypothetical protein